MSHLIQLGKYGLVGSLGTLAHYASLGLLVEFAQCQPAVASSAGFCLGAMINHWLNHKYTFETSRAYGQTLLPFLSVALVGFFVNMICMIFLPDLFALPYFVAQVFATLAVFFITFFLNKFWSFSAT